MHLVGSNTAKRGIDVFMKEVPEETEEDFKKPEQTGSLWVIPDTRGKLHGLLHIFRQSDYCTDALILISQKTSRDYIRYLNERNYTYHIVGEDKCNLSQALELLNAEYGVERLLTDAGSILTNRLIGEGLASEISLLIHPILVGPKGYKMFSNIESSFELELIQQEIFQKRFVWKLYALRA
jgi:2,5-diamino-6-(ribosylamino)-4(3H)-pyrimidinone 5'-phosphate reductase